MSTSQPVPVPKLGVAASSRDLDAARLDLVRRRVLVFTVTVGSLLVLLSIVANLLAIKSGRSMRVVGGAPAFAGLALIILPFFRLRKRRAQMSLRRLVRQTTAIIVLAVFVLMLRAGSTAQSIADLLAAAGLPRIPIGALVPALTSLFVLHFAASLIIPWTLRESAVPVIVIVLIGLLNVPFMTDAIPVRLGGVVALAIAGIPGMLVCWFRFSRLRERVEVGILSRRYREVSHELSFARRIHEKLFPQPIVNGPVRFEFRYLPMREIGGDFIDTHVDDETGSVTIALIDVTGHGIAAALAVNRLHGEMKRILGRRTKVSPGALLAALNEYIHLTLADESVFATAIVLRIDPSARSLTWASAGHPPAMLSRTASGDLEALDSTAMMLGALPPEMFDHGEQSISISVSDFVIVYTDGVIESRDAGERQLGINGLRAVVLTNPRRADASAALDAILQRISQHRVGDAEDDILIAAMSFVRAPPHSRASDEMRATPSATVTATVTRGATEERFHK